jgi:hypothetical protein
VSEHLFGGAGSLLDVDFGVRDFVNLEKALGLATVTAPGS